MLPHLAPPPAYFGASCSFFGASPAAYFGALSGAPENTLGLYLYRIYSINAEKSTIFNENSAAFLDCFARAPLAEVYTLQIK